MVTKLYSSLRSWIQERKAGKEFCKLNKRVYETASGFLDLSAQIDRLSHLLLEQEDYLLEVQAEMKEKEKRKKEILEKMRSLETLLENEPEPNLKEIETAHSTKVDEIIRRFDKHDERDDKHSELKRELIVLSMPDDREYKSLLFMNKQIEVLDYLKKYKDMMLGYLVDTYIADRGLFSLVAKSFEPEQKEFLRAEMKMFYEGNLTRNPGETRQAEEQQKAHTEMPGEEHEKNRGTEGKKTQILHQQKPVSEQPPVQPPAYSAENENKNQQPDAHTFSGHRQAESNNLEDKVGGGADSSAGESWAGSEAHANRNAGYEKKPQKQKEYAPETGLAAADEKAQNTRAPYSPEAGKGQARAAVVLEKGISKYDHAVRQIKQLIREEVLVQYLRNHDSSAEWVAGYVSGRYEIEGQKYNVRVTADAVQNFIDKRLGRAIDYKAVSLDCIV